MNNGFRKSLDFVFAVAVGIVIVVDTLSCADFYLTLARACAFCKG